MEWLLILGLGAWAWITSNRVDVLNRRIDELSRALNQAAPAPRSRVSAGEAHTPANAEEPLLLTEIVPEESAESALLLDTPLPVASNDTEDFDPAEEPLSSLEPLHETPRPAAPALPPMAARAPRGSIEKWLAENGLAWLAGAALALGGIYLVAEAAQQGWFTPPVRLGSATLLGAALIGASEWARGARAGAFAHPLVAALFAGAGAATLYAVAWAAHGIYHFMDWGPAGLALALCSALLLALSTRHGQALGVLAIIGAMFVPPLASLGEWPAPALTLYISAVGLAGFGLAGLRRWPWPAAATLAGLYAWFAAAIGGDDTLRALLLLCLASLGGVALGLRRAAGDDHGDDWRQTQTAMPVATICIGGVLVIWTWLSVAPSPQASPAGPLLAALLHVALAAGTIRARLAHTAAFAVAAGALVFGLASFMRARAAFAPLEPLNYFWALAAAPALGLAALAARPDRHGRTLVAGFGAVGAALLVLLAVFTRAPWHAPMVWAPLFAGAALLFAAAWFTSRHTAAPERAGDVDFWAASGAGLTLIGIESLAPASLRPGADALAALAFAFVLDRFRWRALKWVALSSAALCLAHALSSEFTGATLVGAFPIWRALLVLLASAVALFAASRASQASARDTGEALSGAAIMALVLAAFLGLRWFAAHGLAAPLDAFTEEALHALTFIVAGFVALPRDTKNLGFISRWRGHALMGLGLIMAMVQAGLWENPWWGANPASPLGPPIFNPQALAFAAPAGLAMAAASRLYQNQPMAGRIFAGTGALFALMWTLVEIRRLFHGATSPSAEIGLFEAHCYALVALGGALATLLVARRRAAKDAARPFTQDLARISRGVAGTGIVIAALIMVLLRHPLWGGQDGAQSGETSVSLALLAQAGACALSLVIGRVLSRSDGVECSRFIAAAGAVLFAWSLGHAAIAWLHHRAAMDDGGGLSGLEGFAHALWPLTLVIVGAALTDRAASQSMPRAYVHDLRAIWSVAVWPALIWSALGLWLVFNPWWGGEPAFAASPLAAIIGLAALALAAWLSVRAAKIKYARFASTLAPIARVVCIGHLFVALSLLIRRLYQGPDMRAVLEAGSFETWTYSAAWALFGAGTLALGALRKDSVLRWSGLGILFFVTLKVIAFDTAHLDGVIRAGSVLVLGAILAGATLAARRLGGGREIVPDKTS